ncbi:hypothetical protein F4776DRAFT_658606 [Hypoxylon sp. NC0597]|nr:hypothetical protein F4776DRAFT_658606 [Hypoxylon sp. NC0597]
MDHRRWSDTSVRIITEKDVLSAGITLPLICIALVGVRFYVRRHQETPLAIDDWLIAIGVLMLTGIGICFIIGEQLGAWGHLTADPSGAITPKTYAENLGSEGKIEFAIQILTAFAHGCVKSSIIFFSRRIFVSRRGSPFDWASRILIISSIAWSIACLGTVIFSCGKNVSLRWAPVQSMDASRCDVSKPQEALIISDFILDIMIIILPIPSVWSLNMSWGKKLAVTGMFLVGLMSLAASTSQLVIYFLVYYQTHVFGIDINGAVITILWLNMLENSAAAIASCLPSFTVLVKGTRFRNFSYRLSSGVGHSGWLPLWKTNSGSRRPPQPRADDLDNHSYAIGSISFKDSRQLQVINQQVFLRKDESHV